MSDVTNLTNQSNNETIEAALQQAQQAFSSLAKPYMANVLSTDPIPSEHHINLIDNIADITDYINEQTQKHKELMVHIDSLKEKLSAVSADMKNYHVEDKFATVKTLINKEEKAFMNLTTAHKIEIVIVGIVALGIIVSAFKFL